MKILLLGEYSNVHWTLAEGLRSLGHSVTVVSDGDDWKNYPRDISLHRRSLNPLHTASFLMRLAATLPKLRGYDVVQLINPVFMELCPQRLYPIYRFLRKNNKRMYLGAFGMDYFWVKAGLDCQTFRYSDFNIGSEIRYNPDNERFVAEWLQGDKGKLNRFIADDCDGIVCGLYEYERSYMPHYPQKTVFIPFPINLETTGITQQRHRDDGKIRFFIGIQRKRDAYKGTDVMYKALVRLSKVYPNKMEIVKAESVPFDTYSRMMDACDVLLDQLYSYTPAMNALLAMSKGLVVVGGGEDEPYDLLGEKDLRPIVNVIPDEDYVYHALEQLILHPEDIRRRSTEGIQYIQKHHGHIKVAQQYLEFWSKGLSN